MRCLAGDIGGTNARLANYVDGVRTELVVEPTTDAVASTDLLRGWVEALGGPGFDGCCLAVAGPVFDGQAKLTNVGLTFNEAAVKASTGASQATLVNDMVGLGAAIGELPANRFERLGGVESAGTKGVLAVGTGLGMGIVTGGVCLPSEGGHARVAPAGDFESELVLVTARETGEPVSWEHYLSGRGVAALYRAVCAVWGIRPSDLSAADIVQRDLEGTDPVCDTTLETWVGFLATASGGLAVTALTLGGIYLAGQVAVAVAARLRGSHFRRRFAELAWAADFLEDMPIYLVADPHAGLDGAAIIANRLHANSTAGSGS